MLCFSGSRFILCRCFSVRWSPDLWWHESVTANLKGRDLWCCLNQKKNKISLVDWWWGRTNELLFNVRWRRSEIMNVGLKMVWWSPTSQLLPLHLSSNQWVLVLPLSLIGPQGFWAVSCPCRPSQLWASSSQLPSRRPAFLSACWGETCVPVLPLGQVTPSYWNLFIIVGPMYYIGTRLSDKLIPFFREDCGFHVAGVGAFGL